MLSRIVFVLRRPFSTQTLTTRVLRPVDLASEFTSDRNRQDVLEKMKLADIESSHEIHEDQCKLRLLKNKCLDIDVIHLRIGQPIVYYHRLCLLLERVQYMSTMGLTSREKLRSIQKQPPALILTQLFNSNFCMAHLKGIAMDENNVVHLFCPLHDQILANRNFMQRTVDEIKDSTGVTDSTLLKLAMAIPCYTIDNIRSANWSHVLVHRYLLPKKFTNAMLDLPVLPLVTDRRVQPSAHLCSNAAGEAEVARVKPMELSEVLDYTYPRHHGAGQPASLIDTLDKMERLEAPLEEDRERVF